MKLMRRCALAITLVGVLGTGIHALADTPGCFTLTDLYTCETFLCCPGSSGYSCTPISGPQPNCS